MNDYVYQEYKITVYEDGHWSIDLLFGNMPLGVCSYGEDINVLIEAIKELVYPHLKIQERKDKQ